MEKIKEVSIGKYKEEAINR